MTYAESLREKIAEERKKSRSFQRPRGGLSLNQRFHDARADAFEEALRMYQSSSEVG